MELSGFWGDNQNGQLGDGTQVDKFSPTLFGCPMTSSTSSVETQSDILIYPNPFTGKFQFEIAGLELLENAVLEIFNMQGGLIIQKAMANNKMEIDITDSPKGAYFVKIYTKQALLSKIIVIE